MGGSVQCGRSVPNPPVTVIPSSGRASRLRGSFGGSGPEAEYWLGSARDASTPAGDPASEYPGSSSAVGPGPGAGPAPAAGSSWAAGSRWAAGPVRGAGSGPAAAAHAWGGRQPVGDTVIGMSLGAAGSSRACSRLPPPTCPPPDCTAGEELPAAGANPVPVGRCQPARGGGSQPGVGGCHAGARGCQSSAGGATSSSTTGTTAVGSSLPSSARGPSWTSSVTQPRAASQRVDPYEAEGTTRGVTAAPGVTAGVDDCCQATSGPGRTATSGPGSDAGGSNDGACPRTGGVSDVARSDLSAPTSGVSGASGDSPALRRLRARVRPGWRSDHRRRSWALSASTGRVARTPPARSSARTGAATGGWGTSAGSTDDGRGNRCGGRGPLGAGGTSPKRSSSSPRRPAAAPASIAAWASSAGMIRTPSRGRRSPRRGSRSLGSVMGILLARVFGLAVAAFR